MVKTIDCTPTNTDSGELPKKKRLVTLFPPTGRLKKKVKIYESSQIITSFLPRTYLIINPAYRYNFRGGGRQREQETLERRRPEKEDPQSQQGSGGRASRPHRRRVEGYARLRSLAIFFSFVASLKIRPNPRFIITIFRKETAPQAHRGGGKQTLRKASGGYAPDASAGEKESTQRRYSRGRPVHPGGRHAHL